MAQNITLLGASYTAVPAVTLPKTGGGTAKFSDASVTTAVESDVAEGKTFLLADGSIGMGTASGGGGSSTLITKNITTNGTYNASDDNADGYSSVTVNVPSSSQREIVVPEQTIEVSSNYTQLNYVSPLVEGEEYIYTINGSVYRGTAVYLHGSVAIGTNSIGRIEYQNGMYFGIEGTSLEHGTYTVKVEKEASGGGTGQTATGTVTGDGTNILEIPCNFAPDLIYIYGDMSSDVANRGIVSVTIIKDDLIDIHSDSSTSASQENLIYSAHNITGYNDASLPHASYSNGTLTIDTISDSSSMRFRSGQVYNYELSTIGTGGGSTTPTLVTKEITSNGTYSASDDSADGYSSVTVNVSGGGVDITDGIVVTARDSNGYATAADFYGTAVQPKQFYNRTTGDGGWVNLSTINFKSGVDEIKQSGFFSCGNLTTIDLSSVKTIGSNGFESCKALSLVTLPELTSLGTNAFITCTSLQTFVAPKLMNCNVSRALRQCLALTTVQLGSVGYGVTSISNLFFEHDTQTGLTITIYTTGSYVNTALTNTRNGATNATIIIKASEVTTYGGTSYAAGDTIVTSTP